MEMRLLSAALEDEIEAAQSETLELIKTLCRIPAPSHREERRAAFIREWLEARGFSAEIDDAKNVRCGWGVEESGEIAVVMAHIDTVFPDLEPMPMREEGGRLYCPGVGDDTANRCGHADSDGAGCIDWAYRPTWRRAVCLQQLRRRAGQSQGLQSHYARLFAPRVKAFLSLDDQSDPRLRRARSVPRDTESRRTRAAVTALRISRNAQRD